VEGTIVPVIHRTLYRVAFQTPTEVHADGGFRGRSTTARPSHPNGEQWPADSFCAEIVEGLDPQGIKGALRGYIPSNDRPPGRDKLYLYRFEAAMADIVEVKRLIGMNTKNHEKEGSSGASSSKEVMVLTAIPSNKIAAYLDSVNQWLPLGDDFVTRVAEAIKLRRK
jgi:hypothetical protein